MALHVLKTSLPFLNVTIYNISEYIITKNEFSDILKL